MFLNGSLENFSVADILQLLSFSKQSGALHVLGEVTGVLYLEDGELYFATKEGAWPLEDTVAAAGIPREDWNAAMGSAGHSHAAGQALTDRGVPADLIGYVVHRLVSDTTFELMQMPRAEGSFDFRVGEKHAVGPVHRLRVDDLVAEVGERLAEWEAVSEFISSPSDLVSAPSELAEETVELSVSREQWALLVATIRNDHSTVSDLARETARSEAEVARALYPLISSGLVEVEARGEAAVAGPPAPEVRYSPPPPVFETDSGPLAPEVPEVIEVPEVVEEPLGPFDFPPAPDPADSDYSDEVLKEPGPELPAPPQEEPSWWGDQPEAEGLPSDQPEGLPSDQAEGLPSDQAEGLPSENDETTLSWDPVEPQTTEGLPSDQPEGLLSDKAELEIIEPSGSELDDYSFEGDSAEQEPVGDSEAWFPAVPEEAPEETALWSDPEAVDTLDTSRPLFEPEQAEETEETEAEALTEAAGPETAESPLWDLGGAGTDLEEEHPAEEQPAEEPPLSPAETIDVGQPDIESAGFRTLALQELRDLAGTAPVQPATGPRSSNSRKPAGETSDEPPSQPKVRALRRIIARVRGL